MVKCNCGRTFEKKVHLLEHLSILRPGIIQESHLTKTTREKVLEARRDLALFNSEHFELTNKFTQKKESFENLRGGK